MEFVGVCSGRQRQPAAPGGGGIIDWDIKPDSLVGAGVLLAVQPSDRLTGTLGELFRMESDSNPTPAPVGCR